MVILSRSIVTNISHEKIYLFFFFFVTHANLYNGAGLDCASHSRVTLSPIYLEVPSNFDLGGKRGGLLPNVSGQLYNLRK